MKNLLLALGATTVLATTMAVAANAASLGQHVQGTSWELVSLTVMTPDGKEIQPDGPHPMGYTMFDRTGHFITVTMKPGAPKFASDNLRQGTDAEYRAAGLASLVDFGTYTADDKTHTLIMHVKGASFPNWIGTDVENVTEFEGDQMIWHNTSGPQKLPVLLVWKRPTKND